MWRHYLVVAARNLMRNPGFVCINLAGLATGIAFCILSGLFVWHEWRYDRFHKDVDSIHRVVKERQTPKGVSRSALLPENAGPLLADFVPEIEQAVQVWDGLEGRVSSGGEALKERPFFVDPEFLTVFSFPLLQGDPETALGMPQAAVITDALAQKYFRDEDPMGKELVVTHFKWRYEPKTFVVQAVVQNPPENSSIQFGLLLPIEVLPPQVVYRYSNGKRQRVELPNTGKTVDFRHASDRVFVRLVAGANIARVEARMADFMDRHRGKNKHFQHLALKLQPLREVHFDRRVRGGLEPTGNPVYAYILTGLALGVLLIACINFVNLSLARSTARATEVGIRKIVGAQRRQLMQQFWGESVLLSGLAFVFGLALAEFLLPTFNALIQTNLAMKYGLPWILCLGILALVLGLVSGSYPAVVLSRFDAVVVLKSRLRIGGKHWFGRGLVVFQFVVSALLVVVAVVMSGQLDYVQQKDLGFDEEQVVIVSGGEWKPLGYFFDARRIRSQGLDAYKQALMACAGVVGATRVEQFVSENPAVAPLPVPLRVPDRDPVMAETFLVDYDFLNTMGIELLAGRNFSSAFGSDIQDAVIVNETLVKELGQENPLQTVLPFRRDKLLDEKEVVVQNPSVIGVVADFHFRSLHQPIRPLVLHLHPQPEWNLFVRIRPEGVPQTLASMKSAWAEITDGAPFEYEFLDERINRQYQTEMRWGRIVRYASLFAVFVACLGVLGLTAQAMVRRTREIGIRKALGASVRQIVTLLSKEFVWLMATANLIALPLAYHAMERWLQNFAYRIDLGIGILALGVLLTMGTALTTVALQAFWAARANPVDVLRSE